MAGGCTVAEGARCPVAGGGAVPLTGGMTVSLLRPADLAANRLDLFVFGAPDVAAPALKAVLFPLNIADILISLTMK